MSGEALRADQTQRGPVRRNYNCAWHGRRQEPACTGCYRDPEPDPVPPDPTDDLDERARLTARLQQLQTHRDTHRAGCSQARRGRWCSYERVLEEEITTVHTALLRPLRTATTGAVRSESLRDDTPQVAAGSDESGAPETGWCLACGQLLVDTPDEQGGPYHPYNLPRICPPERGVGGVPRPAFGTGFGRPGRDCYVPGVRPPTWLQHNRRCEQCTPHEPCLVALAAAPDPDPERVESGEPLRGTDTPASGGLTPTEQEAVRRLAQAMNLWTVIVSDGPTRTWDVAEFGAKIHDLQHAVMAQAAARAHPDLYRLAGHRTIQ